MQVIACTQRSAAWHQARLGRLTGSRAASLRGAAGRQTLLQALVRERITGRSHEADYQNAHMARGVALEPSAVAAYEGETGAYQVGFLVHDELQAGYSPDGLVGDEGLLEVKCPSAHIHFDNVVTGAKMPATYHTQITHGLWLSGRAWADLVSFNPDFGPRLRVQVTRLYARDLDLVAYNRQVRVFLADVDAACARVPRVSVHSGG